MRCHMCVIVVVCIGLWAAGVSSIQDADTHRTISDNRIVAGRRSSEEEDRPTSDQASRVEMSPSRESSESQEEHIHRSTSAENKERRRSRIRDRGQSPVQDESDRASRRMHNNRPRKNTNKTINGEGQDGGSNEHDDATSVVEESSDVPNRRSTILRQQPQNIPRKSKTGRRKSDGYVSRKDEKSQRRQDRIDARLKGYSICDERLQFRKLGSLPSRRNGMQRKEKFPSRDDSFQQDEFKSLSQGAEQMMQQWMVEAQRVYPEEFEKMQGEWGQVMATFQLETNMNEMMPSMKGENRSSGNNDHPNPRQMNEIDAIDSSYGEHQMNQTRETAERQPYTTVCVSPSGYELRQYAEAAWVATTVNTSSYDFAGMIGYKRIFRYIQGENSQGVKIAMTVPLRKKIRNEGGNVIAPVSLLRNESFTVCMYLPAEYADNPPLPLDEEIFIERSSYSAYAFNFSGWAYGLNVFEKYFEYRRMLLLNDEHFTEGDFTVQMYDTPWIIDYRHNELLIPVNSEDGSLGCNEIVISTDKKRRCESFQCPILREMETLSYNISTRLIDAGMYVVKKASTCDLESGLTTLTRSLQHYFHWANSRSVNMGRTLRTLQFGTRLLPSDDAASNCSYSLETALHLPQQFHHNPPTPCDDSMVIRRIDQMVYYVLSFRDVEQRPTDQEILEAYENTKAFLVNNGRCFNSDKFIFATCDFRSLRDSALPRFELYIPVKNC